MELFTKIAIPASDFRIDYTQKIAFIGSCFAEKISEKFADLKFKVLKNPFGILYNPLSIEIMCENIAQQKIFTESDIFLDERTQDFWHCWHTHGSLSHRDKMQCLDGLNRAAAQARRFLENTSVIFITLGSAYVYFLKENGAQVANCHKQNAALFERRLISVESASQALQNTIMHLHQINKNMQIVFTVSPIRHLNDGAQGNSLSKSTLHLAIHRTLSTNEKNLSYFPSYEIVMDELRDYRFYHSDMIHLAAIAEQIVFERMQQTYMNPQTIENTKRVASFLKSVNHKMIDKTTKQSQEFIQNCISTTFKLENDIPGLDLTREREILQHQTTNFSLLC